MPHMQYPRLQIVTIEELLAGKKLEYPWLGVATFKMAERKTKRRPGQRRIFDTEEGTGPGAA